MSQCASVLLACKHVCMYVSVSVCEREQISVYLDVSGLCACVVSEQWNASKACDLSVCLCVCVCVCV